MNSGKQATGFFICRCGGNISEKVDIDSILKLTQGECGATYAVADDHLCSAEGQEKIRQAAKVHGLDRVIVAACSPLQHEITFRSCLESSGLNPYMLEMANIREQCAWVTTDATAATEKAKMLIKGAFCRVLQAQPLSAGIAKSEKSAAIIGGGVAGITAALSLAGQGIRVHLIEKRESIGGNMVRVGKVFSPDKLAEECALCALSPMMAEVARNPLITIHTLSTVISVEGYAGRFTTTIKKDPSGVDIEKCIGCGACAKVCPIEVPDWWNAGLKKRKAIFRPFPQAVPPSFNIDWSGCTRCGKCVKVCKHNAINLEVVPKTEKVTVGAIVIATGHREYDATKKPELGYGRFTDVITQTELSRITAVNGPTLGKLLRPSDGRPPRRVVMIQCVGSRDEKPDGNRYCSKVCCMVATKHANHIKSFAPFTDVVICYMDMRTPGTYEHYFRHAQENGVRYIRGKPAEVVKGNNESGELIVRLEDTLSGSNIELEADLVVLSEGIEPSDGTQETASALAVGMGQDGFIRERHPKLKPVSTDVEGIYACGTALGPKDITDSVTQAGAAAVKAAELLSGHVRIEPRIISIDPALCDSCGNCTTTCRFRAIYLEGGHANVNEIACAGCGGCIIACPKGAITQPFCTDGQLNGLIDGILANTTKGNAPVLAFLDSGVAYIAADNLGANRLDVPQDIIFIRIPSANRLGQSHILRAFEKGARGVFIGEGPENGPMGRMFSNAQERFQTMRAEIGKHGIDPRRLFFTKVYAPHYRGLLEKLEFFKKELDSVESQVSNSVKVHP